MAVFKVTAKEAVQFFKYPVLILDQTEEVSHAPLPPHFRQTAFKVSGSGQFNKAQLIHAMQEVKLPIYIIDLRQESHGFINNEIPVSWYGERDWLNKALNLKQVIVLEKKLLAQLVTRESVNFVIRDKVLKEVNTEEGLYGTAKALVVQQSMTEEQLARSLGFYYVRIPVTDHMAPTEIEVKHFLVFYKTLNPEQVWLHFHCHGGDGRTTTFMVMADILRNGTKESLETILKRQKDLGGRDLMHINPARTEWFTTAAQQRLVFLQKFYKYVHSGDYARGIAW